MKIIKKYLEASKLFCYVISKSLSTREFKWIDPKEFYLNNLFT